MKILKSIILISLISITSLAVYGQQDEKDLQGEEVSVEASYKPYVPKASKIKIQPKVEKDKMEKPDFQYVLEPITLESKVELKPIVAARVKSRTTRKDFPGNYVKAGFGNYASPLIEFSAANKQSKEYAYGLFLKHESSWGDYKDYAFPGYNNNLATVYFNRFFDSHTLEVKPFYQRNDYHFYGIKLEDTLISKDFTPSNTVSKMGLDLRFYSHKKDDDILKKDIQLHYDYLNAYSEFAPEVKEHLITFNTDLYKSVFWINKTEEQNIGGSLGFDFISRDTSFHGLVHLNPRYEFSRGIYDIEVGVNSVLSIGDSTRADFFPFAKVEFNVLPGFLKLYVKLDGNVDHNTYHSMIKENPFIFSNAPGGFTKTRYAKEGGIKGNISKTLDFNLSFMNANIQDMLFLGQPMLLTDKQGTHPFVYYAPLYDTVNFSRIALDLNYQHENKIQALFHFQYDNYDTRNLLFAYMKPEITSFLMVNYQLNHKLRLNTKLQYIGKRKYYGIPEILELPPFPVLELDPTIDINLGAEYQIMDNFSAFLDLNNILNRRNYVQAYYPTKRFNFMAGIKFRF